MLLYEKNEQSKEPQQKKMCDDSGQKHSSRKDQKSNNFLIRGENITKIVDQLIYH